MLFPIRAIWPGTTVIALPGMATMLIGTLLPVSGLAQRPLFHIGGVDAEIMFGVLKVVFRCDPVTRAGGITRQTKILLVNLKRVPANAHARSVAVEELLTIGTSSPTIATARAFRALALFHVS